MTIQVTINGGLTGPLELKQTQAGKPYVSGTVASTRRKRDDAGNWVDARKLYVRFSAFGQIAENIAASDLPKGAKVSVTGELFTREYTDQQGNPRSAIELEVREFAAGLAFASVVLQPNQRGGQGGYSAAPAGGFDSPDASGDVPF